MTDKLRRESFNNSLTLHAEQLLKDKANKVRVKKLLAEYEASGGVVEVLPNYEATKKRK